MRNIPESVALQAQDSRTVPETVVILSAEPLRESLVDDRIPRQARRRIHKALRLFRSDAGRVTPMT